MTDREQSRQPHQSRQSQQPQQPQYSEQSEQKDSPGTVEINAPQAKAKLGRLNHVAMVVPDLASATATWRDMLGATVSTPRALPEHGVTVVFIDLPNTRLELLEPLGDGSPVSRFLEKHTGGGLHHICLEVDDVRVARDELTARGARVLGDGEPKIGAHGNPVIFLHPADLNGTLLELEEVRTA